MNKAAIDGILGDFHRISGMDVSLLNVNFHTVSVFKGNRRGVCSLVQSGRRTNGVCRGSDLDRLCEVRRNCEAVIYTCPCGITEVIIPVIREGGIVAYLFCSMGIREGCEESTAAALRALPLGLAEGDICHAVSVCRVLTDGEINAYFSILKLIAEHISTDPTPAESDESIGRLVKYYVKNNLDRKITLSDISDSLHCSTVTLTEHFKAEFGITIMEYVTKKRMEYAEKLLLTTAGTLSEISVLAGFSDVEYFSRTFKKHHGMPPAAWRRSHGKE